MMSPRSLVLGVPLGVALWLVLIAVTRMLW